MPIVSVHKVTNTHVLILSKRFHEHCLLGAVGTHEGWLYKVTHCLHLLFTALCCVPLFSWVQYNTLTSTTNYLMYVCTQINMYNT